MNYDILEQLCASTPDQQHYIIIHAQNSQTGDNVWAIGDDQVCAITSADFIRNPNIKYNDVCIQEFPYRDNTPESVGIWKPLIEELVRTTVQKYLSHDGLVHVYPQWLPEDMKLTMCDLALKHEMFSNAESKIDHLILYANHSMDIVPIESTPTMESPTF